MLVLRIFLQTYEMNDPLCLYNYSTMFPLSTWVLVTATRIGILTIQRNILARSRICVNSIFTLNTFLIEMEQMFTAKFILVLLKEAVAKKCSVKKVFIEILQNSRENTCARVSFLIKRLWHRCFLVNFVKFLRTLFLTEHLWWLLLYWAFWL